jgi:acyl-CoA hydrolase
MIGSTCDRQVRKLSRSSFVHTGIEMCTTKVVDTGREGLKVEVELREAIIDKKDRRIIRF